MDKFLEGFMDGASAYGLGPDDAARLLKVAEVMTLMETSPAFVEGVETELMNAERASVRTQ